jgi:hypothetical protein
MVSEGSRQWIKSAAALFFLFDRTSCSRLIEEKEECSRQPCKKAGPSVRRQTIGCKKYGRRKTFGAFRQVGFNR